MRVRRLMFALVATALALGALEGAARLAEPRLPETMPLPFPMAKDPAFEKKLVEARRRAGDAVPLVANEWGSWSVAPKSTEQYGNTTMRFNSLGIRGPEVTPRAADEQRLFTLGDSSILGLGVMETQVFSSVAAAALAERCGCTWSAVIGGIPGYSTGQALELQARIQVTVAPTWVVIGALWSDVLRDITVPRTRTKSRFALYRVGLWALAPWLPAGTVRFLDSRDDISDAAHPARTPLGAYATNLDTLADRAEAAGARVAFLILPAPLDLDRELPPEAVRRYRDAMRTVAEAHGAPLVDGPALAAARGATLAWWDDQVHPSSLGHQQLGLALADAISGVR